MIDGHVLDAIDPQVNVGYGSIGRECARQLHALGLRIVALDPAGRRDEGPARQPQDEPGEPLAPPGH